MARNKTEQKKISPHSGRAPDDLCPGRVGEFKGGRHQSGSHQPVLNDNGLPHEPFGTDCRGTLHDALENHHETGRPFADLYGCYICRHCACLYTSVVYDPAKETIDG